MKNCSDGQKGYLSSTSDCPIKPKDINYTNKKNNNYSLPGRQGH